MASSDAITLDLFMEKFPEFDNISNYNRILGSMRSWNTRVSDETILACIEREGIQYTAETQQALREFFTDNPRWNYDKANVRLLLDHWKQGGFSYMTAETLASAAGEGMAETVEYKAAMADNSERAGLIRAISQNKPTYQMFVKVVGAFRNFDTADLQNESTERLREIAGVVAEQARVRSLEPAQVRAEVHQTSGQRYSQYLDLPPAMPDGRPWSIYNFNKQPVALIKDQIRKYGVENINAACQAAATQGAQR